MKRFLIDTSVLNAEGSQTWFVDAETEAEALEKFKEGCGDLYESNVDVTSLDEPEISGEVPLDDFGSTSIPGPAKEPNWSGQIGRLIEAANHAASKGLVSGTTNWAATVAKFMMASAPADDAKGGAA